MKHRKTRRQAWLAALISTASLMPQVVNATIVEFQTVMGNFQVNLYDNSTPATVTNFLTYVNNGDYTSSVMHRSVAGFVVPGGGSIAMAKLGGDPNSATSQWFFNLSNNAANLDGQNGGFTVFGEVVGDGMDVVDAIAALPVFDFAGATAEIPLRDYTVTDFNNGVPVDETNLVIINAIVVTDSTVDSAAGLNPPLTTNQPDPPGNGGGGGGGGGGAFGFLSLFGLLLAVPHLAGRWSSRRSNHSS
jgi:peptidyl-prolyl cis-trans isomerase A (cyclophilin A)